MEATGTARRYEIRKALGRLVTKGAQPYWVMEAGRALLGLAAVRERLKPDDINDPEAETAALVAVLREAIDRLGHRPESALLTAVLGLDRDLLGRSAHERRAIAGRVFRGESARVAAGTIRQHHEPKALDLLAEVLWSDEERRTQSEIISISTRAPSPQPSPDRGECVLWLEGGDRVDGIVGSVEEVRSEIDRALDGADRWVQLQRRSDADGNVQVLAIRAATIIGITAPE